jgi:hypothetical protein
MKILLFSMVSLLCCGILRAADAAATPSVHITVKAVSEGTDRSKHTAVSSRRLRIVIENRESRRLEGLKLDWSIYGKDIGSHNKKVDAKGTKPVTLEANGETTVESDVAKFTEKEGVPKTVGKGKNKRRVAQPDTGRDYAGYVVELKQGGKVIAEASTVGLGK